MSHFELISDHSKEKLEEVPSSVMKMSCLKMLFLEGNCIKHLPSDFFCRLPKLMWLDLRNNKLKTIPKSVAHHEYLENILLTNNRIEKLPNELGLVPSLKTLQVADNPLIYPSKKVINQGVPALKNYLKKQYENEHPKNQPEEDILKVVEEAFSSDLLECKKHKRKDKSPVRKDVLKAHKSAQNPHPQLDPLLKVQRFNGTELNIPIKVEKEPIKIIHQMQKGHSKLSLKSYFNKKGVKSNLENVKDGTLKEGWLNKLRVLLVDQERILQQEKNLKALSSWRMSEKKKEREGKMVHKEHHSEPPFAVYPEYNKIPTREELAKELNAFLRERNTTVKNSRGQNNSNIEKLINDLVKELRDMETTYKEVQSPRTEIEQAGKQIKTIMEIHKKLICLKASNDSTL